MTPRARKLNQSGFTLVELVVVIIVLGIIAAVATSKMGVSIETAKYEHTKNELDAIARAIVGNPAVYSNGARSDFGYVGDVGSLPANLDALAQNPGSYSTWNGPYISDGFTAGEYKKDAWGVNYTYTDTLLRSTGSGSNIDKLFAISSARLLSNNLTGVMLDANLSTPGATYGDSVSVRLTYPDGSGGTTTSSTTLSANGNFSFSGVPVGNHTLTVIYIPDSDTVTYPTAMYPGETINLNIVFPADLW